MAKVHVIHATTGANTYAVRFNKLSLAFSCLFVANLVTEPLKAYVNEPLPWMLDPPLLNHQNDGTFVNSTYQLFAAKFNNETLSPDTMFSRDKGANIALLRYNVTLPSKEVDHCNYHLLQFPGQEEHLGNNDTDLPILGAILFGNDMIAFVCNFLAQNASTQRAMPRYMCQHLTIGGSFVISHTCLWIVPLSSSGSFSAYHAFHVVDQAPWSWMKFGLRLGVSAYIFVEVWRLYCRHYIPLLYNLKILGIQHDDRIPVVYEIQVGDPTWIILCHPYICVAMTVDILYSTAYSMVSLFRVSQLQDSWQFVVGSFSGSNFVWASYTAMRFSTPLIKFLRWESKFEPLDPGIMTLTSAFYAGPMIYLMCQSPLVLMMQFLDSSSPTAIMEANEVSLGMSTFLFLFASVPLFHAAIARLIHQRKGRTSMFHKKEGKTQ
ncbi:Aste57867_19753 [Aphanomyces stellatus]|uniref:Aste57867_19753 protein n=1 Tax=Aphanomyces stellatus TaxID=120398 RepID=A0A485LHX4_9STRA|nr:hypothetical protein As57867_019688 [Aphanomyces stellatus]VFT96451.1 Aste57867_19753 [Aphanomyces stellatus]